MDHHGLGLHRLSHASGLDAEAPEVTHPGGVRCVITTAHLTPHVPGGHPFYL